MIECRYYLGFVERNQNPVLGGSSKIFLLTVDRRYFFCGSLVLSMSCGGHLLGKG